MISARFAGLCQLSLRFDYYVIYVFWVHKGNLFKKNSKGYAMVDSCWGCSFGSSGGVLTMEESTGGDDLRGAERWRWGV